jgi:hypothetical protein
MIKKICPCGKLQEFLEEEKVALSYFAPHREYSIKLSSSGGGQNIYFCPWCGNKLPKSLADEWFDRLEAMGFDEPFEQCRTDPDFPEEYKTDAWWKSDPKLA